MRKAKETPIDLQTELPELLPEDREKQMINLAELTAEKQMREGKASSQVIVHYLKLGTKREQVQLEILQRQKELIEAKTESIKSQKKVEELFADALSSLKEYKGESEDDEEDY